MGRVATVKTKRTRMTSSSCEDYQHTLIPLFLIVILLEVCFFVFPRVCVERIRQERNQCSLVCMLTQLETLVVDDFWRVGCSDGLKRESAAGFAGW